MIKENTIIINGGFLFSILVVMVYHGYLFYFIWAVNRCYILQEHKNSSAKIDGYPNRKKN